MTLRALPQDDVRTGRPRWITDFMLVAAASLAYVVILLLLFRFPPRASDQMIYFTAAEDPSAVRPTHITTRLGVVVPTALAQLVFGYSEAAYYAVPIISAIALMSATYLLSRSLIRPARHSRSISMVASLLLGLSPLVLLNATHLLSDIGAAAFLTLGLALIFYHARDVTPPRGCSLLPVAALAFGISYLFRQTIVLALPGVATIGWYLGLRWRHILNAWPAIILLIADALWGWYIWGDPLARLLGVVTRSAGGAAPSPVEIASWTASLRMQQDIGASLGVFPDLLIDNSGLVLGLGILVGIALLIGSAVVLGDRLLRALTVYLVVLWLAILLVGTVGTAGGFPLLTLSLPRNWYPILPALFVGALAGIYFALRLAFGMSRTLTRSIPSVMATAGLGIIAALYSAAVAAGGPSELLRIDSDRFREFRSWLTETEIEGEFSIVTDERSPDILRIYQSTTFGSPVWEGSISGLPVTGMPVVVLSENELLVINKPAVWRAHQASPEVPAPWTSAPPPDLGTWRVSSDGHLLVFRVQGGRWTEWSGADWVVKSGTEGPLDSWQARPNAVNITLGSGTVEVQLFSSASALTTQKADFVDVLAQVQLSGSTSYEVLCAFSDERGETRSSRAISVAAFTPPSGAARSVCRIPPDLAPPLQFLPRIRVNGPGEVTIGPVAARAAAPSG